jgi:hypothetical protein
MTTNPKLALLMGRFTAEDAIKSLPKSRCIPELIFVPVASISEDHCPIIPRSKTMTSKGVPQMKEKGPRPISNQGTANVTKPTADMQEQIRRRAYELYERRATPGYELEDWLQAESEVAQKMRKGAGA